MSGLSDSINDTRLEQLRVLLAILADKIDQRPGARDLAQLSRQYRETIREIEEIEGAENNEDEIAELLQKRDSDGKAGAVRKNST